LTPENSRPKAASPDIKIRYLRIFPPLPFIVIEIISCSQPAVNSSDSGSIESEFCSAFPPAELFSAQSIEGVPAFVSLPSVCFKVSEAAILPNLK